MDWRKGCKAFLRMRIKASVAWKDWLNVRQIFEVMGWCCLPSLISAKSCLFFLLCWWGGGVLVKSHQTKQITGVEEMCNLRSALGCKLWGGASREVSMGPFLLEKQCWGWGATENWISIFKCQGDQRKQTGHVDFVETVLGRWWWGEAMNWWGGGGEEIHRTGRCLARQT